MTPDWRGLLLSFLLVKLPEARSVQYIVPWFLAMVGTPLLALLGSASKGLWSPRHPIPLARGSHGPSPSLPSVAPTLTPSCHVAPFIPVAGLTVGCPDDLFSLITQDALCPQETLDSHCASCSVIGKSVTGKRVPGTGRGGGFALLSLPELLHLTQSTDGDMPGGLLSAPHPRRSIPPSPHSAIPYLFPTPHIPAQPLPPGRPLQELEGMGFSSLSCRAVGPPHRSVALALGCHSLTFFPKWHRTRAFKAEALRQAWWGGKGLAFVITQVIQTRTFSPNVQLRQWPRLLGYSGNTARRV